MGVSNLISHFLLCLAPLACKFCILFWFKKLTKINTFTIKNTVWDRNKELKKLLNYALNKFVKRTNTKVFKYMLYKDI